MLKERYTMFQNTNGLHHNSNLIMIHQENLDAFSPENKIKKINEIKNKNFIFNKPINRNIQKNAISLITMADLSNDFYNKYYKYVYTFTFPLLVLITFSIFAMIKYKNINSLIFLGIILKTIIIFLTAPMSFFMYYLPVYLQGYIIILFFIINFILSKFFKYLT